LFTSNKIVYKYVVLVDTDSKEKRRKTLNRLKIWLDDSEIHRLSIGIFNLPKEIFNSGFPYTNFMIIDSQEVFAYYPSELGSPEYTYSIKHPYILQMYNNYFANVWSRSTLIDLDGLDTLINEIDKTSKNP
jgi:hypothetical protein